MFMLKIKIISIVLIITTVVCVLLYKNNKIENLEKDLGDEKLKVKMVKSELSTEKEERVYVDIARIMGDSLPKVELNTTIGKHSIVIE